MCHLVVSSGSSTATAQRERWEIVFSRNEMPEFVPEEAEEEETVSAGKVSLKKLLSLPYRSFSEKLQSYAVVQETWERSGKCVGDYSLYTGVLGTAHLLFKSYQVTRNEDDLKLCSEIVEASYVASRDSERVTFICGHAGVCALGAVAAKHIGDDQLQSRYLTRFLEIRLPSGLPNESLYGRAGYLWACSFLNKHIGKDSVSSARMRPVVEEIFREGRQMGEKRRVPFDVRVAREEVLGCCSRFSRDHACLDKSEKLISEGEMHGGDRPFSLFEGIGGMAYMFLDMKEPTQALFPGYELYNV